MEEDANTIIVQMSLVHEERLKKMPLWRRLWRRLWGPTHEEWIREFDAAVALAPKRRGRRD
jgi:hypothetical protein